MAKAKRRQAGIPWKTVNKKGLDEAQDVFELDTGMFAHIPIICRGITKCPYAPTCFIDPANIIVDERCPIEMGAIITRFDDYCRSLEVTELDSVDMSLVKELVDIEVQILRAESLLASDGNFLKEVVATVDTRGKPYYRSEVHPAIEGKNALRAARHKVLNQLNSTRKDRDSGKKVDPSTAAAELVARAAQLLQAGKLVDTIKAGEPNESNS